MIKVYETKEEKKAAFKRSIGLRKVWEDLTSGKMSFDEFKRQGYNPDFVKILSIIFLPL